MVTVIALLSAVTAADRVASIANRHPSSIAIGRTTPAGAIVPVIEMRYIWLGMIAISLVVNSAASARTRSSGYSSPRSCHCDRYTNPHYSGFAARSGPYRGGRSYRY